MKSCKPERRRRRISKTVSLKEGEGKRVSSAKGNSLNVKANEREDLILKRIADLESIVREINSVMRLVILSII